LTDVGAIADGEILAIVSQERCAAADRADRTLRVVPATQPAIDFA
jgi:hypothetical protein